MRYILKSLWVLLIVYLSIILGIILKKEKTSDLYDSYVKNKPYTIIDIIRDERLSNLTEKSYNFYTIGFVVLFFTLHIRFLVIVSSFFYFIYYLCRFKTLLFFTRPEIIVSNSCYTLSFHLTYSHLFVFLFLKQSNYIGYYYAYKVCTYSRQSFSFSLVKQYVSNICLGTNSWVLTFSVKITDDILNNQGVLHIELPYIIIHNLLYRFNKILISTKDMRVYKENNCIYYNPGKNDIIVNSTKDILNGFISGSTKIRTPLRNGKTLIHYGVAVSHTDEFNIDVQATGNPIKHSRYIEIEARNYRKSTVSMMYNIIRDVKLVSPMTSS